jgi:hypothetical protein
MTKVIAIFLLLKAVSNGIKLPQRGDKTNSDFIGHIIVEANDINKVGFVEVLR